MIFKNLIELIALGFIIKWNQLDFKKMEFNSKSDIAFISLSVCKTYHVKMNLILPPIDDVTHFMKLYFSKAKDVLFVKRLAQCSNVGGTKNMYNTIKQTGYHLLQTMNNQNMARFLKLKLNLQQVNIKILTGTFK